MSKPFKSIVGNKFFILLLLVAAGVFGTIQYTQWQKRSSIEKEVESLAREEQALEAKNKEIKDSLEFLHTQSAKERIARQQLNMKKEDEIVIGFPKDLETTEDTAPKVEKTNPQKWWEYFFGEGNI